MNDVSYDVDRMANRWRGVWMANGWNGHQCDVKQSQTESTYQTHVYEYHIIMLQSQYNQCFGH